MRGRGERQLSSTLGASGGVVLLNWRASKRSTKLQGSALSVPSLLSSIHSTFISTSERSAQFSERRAISVDLVSSSGGERAV